MGKSLWDDANLISVAFESFIAEMKYEPLDCRMDGSDGAQPPRFRSTNRFIRLIGDADILK